jgi:two-component system chemotaxis response regulator CheB
MDPANNNPVRVMLAVLRQVLAAVLNADPRLQVVATAPDPVAAMKRMQSDWPDVLVLDVEMPKMDGITFLRQVMAERPTPVLICSTLTEKGAATTLQALQAGAVGFITKPTLGLRDFLQDQAGEFCRMVLDAARARPRRQAAPMTASIAAPMTGHLAASAAGAGSGSAATPGALLRTTERFVAVGASTGGTQALQAVLLGLPRTCPGIVVVQHMPETFTGLLARQLDGICNMEVREAVNGDRVLPGLVLIAPGGRHMQVKRHGAHYRVEVFDAPHVNRHRPSVDVLFRSVAQAAGSNALGIIMTGMGADGARGLLAMRQAGARTRAQDEDSCVVFGMPKEAIAMGAVDQVRPLAALAGDIMAFEADELR